MAQTKTKTQARSKSSTKSTKTKSQGNSRRATTGARSTKARSSSTRNRSQKRTSSQAKGRSRRSQGAKRSSPGTNSQNRGLMDRVKGPATVAGVALLGGAGMAAASRTQKKGGGLAKTLKRPSMPRPDLKKAKKALKKMDLPNADAAIDWVEDKAKGVGDTGYRVADMTSQARTVKKAVSGK